MSSTGAAKDLRAAVRRWHRSPEAEVLAELMPLAQLDDARVASIQQRALDLSSRVRQMASGESGVQALLNEYDLSSDEGIVLMCLAEALLRVPDNDTADKLIQDKILKGDWAANLDSQDSFFVHASAWGLLLTGKVVGFNKEESGGKLLGLGRVIGGLGEPVIRVAMRQAMRIMGTQFVLGRSISEACQNAQAMEAQGYRYSYDMLGEASRTQQAADEYLASYRKAIEKIGEVSGALDHQSGPGISIKLSALHPRYEYANSERVHAELYPRLKQLVLLAKRHDIGVSIDAEEADRLELSLELIERLFTDAELAGWGGFGVVVQAYQKRSLDVVKWLVALARQQQNRLMLRLVKGAYWDAEIKHAQQEGLDGYPVFTRKASTDVSYRACARYLLENRDVIYPQFATHNANTVSAVVEMAGDTEGYEFQRLHGMGDELYACLREDIDIPCRIYAPVGEHEDLLAYLVRRLLENGANTSFVNKIVDDSVPLESLVADPVAKVQSWQQKANPGIVKPEAIYGDSRRNSSGIDLNDRQAHRALSDALEQWWATRAAADNEELSLNPANSREVVGSYAFVQADEFDAIVNCAQQAHASWAQQQASERAAVLRRFADTLQAHEAELIALCCKEAGKTLADGVGEVREAIDFCRYYADEAEALQHAVAEARPLGVVLCISPWNFPLAIFLGQVCAALSVGNCVIAKPAEQTSLIALRARELMLQSGVPADAVQVVCARGIDAGNHLVPDARIKAVMFTGSTGTAQWIARRLADRPGPRVPLIAETGGQNCMVADSTALTEQLVDDVISSGFQSAGQRCSALRVLYIQDDAADSSISMIAGAMKELRIGDPALLETDVGPVIDDRALQALNEHVAYMDGLCAGGKARLVYQCELGPQCSGGTFFAPRLYEIDSIDLLRGEVFGPVVHAIRYKARELDRVIEQINSTGFGLTAGVHSRIDASCSKVAEGVDAGNIYVNRNIIGAIVGVQPFGGHGLSGTGPKAGGPSYLYRLVRSEATPAFTETHLASLSPEQRETESVPPAWLERQQRWSAEPLEQRVQILAGLQRIHLDEALLQCARDELAQPRTLPGPTGESNVLSVQARGLLLWLPAADEDCAQAAAALLAGNGVLCLQAEATPAARELSACEHLPFFSFTNADGPGLHQLLALPQLKGVLCRGNEVALRTLEQHLRERPAAILPLIDETHPLLLLKRLLIEKHVSTDTTASGGNASLLALGEQD